MSECCWSDFRKNNKGIKELIRGLEDRCYYVVKVSQRDGNPPFLAILYTGFISSGGYQSLFVCGDAFEIDRRAVGEIVQRIGVFNHEEGLD